MEHEAEIVLGDIDHIQRLDQSSTYVKDTRSQVYHCWRRLQIQKTRQLERLLECWIRIRDVCVNLYFWIVSVLLYNDIHFPKNYDTQNHNETTELMEKWSWSKYFISLKERLENNKNDRTVYTCSMSRKHINTMVILALYFVKDQKFARGSRHQKDCSFCVVVKCGRRKVICNQTESYNSTWDGCDS